MIIDQACWERGCPCHDSHEEGVEVEQIKGEEHMKPKLLPLLERCISDGAERGWHRAHKHHDEPDERYILNEIENCVMTEIFEWFEFEEHKDA